MGTVIGDLLPLAVGVAVSPVPVIAVILMLFGPRPAGSSAGFLAGWVLGIAAVVTVALLVSGGAGASDDGPSTAVAVVKLLLGLLLLALAVRQWRSRPRAGEEAHLPAWMGAIDAMTPVRGLGLGVLLSAVNPKNLALGLAAGVTIADAGLTTGAAATAVIVFTVLAAATVALPVLAYALARDRVQKPLAELRSWLEENNATVMSVLLLVLGAVAAGQGLRALG